jgi:PAS domain S-box-containing protein
MSGGHASARDPADLRVEIATLRERMHEAEEVYRALTKGEVDAVVAGPDEQSKNVLVMKNGDDSEQATVDAIRSGMVDAFVVGEDSVQLLESAEAPYRTAMERMHDGAVTVDIDGTIAFVNESFASMMKTSKEKLIGRRLTEMVDLADAATLTVMLRSQEDRQSELRLRGADGADIAVYASMTSLESHKLFLLQDITLRKLHRAIDTRTRRFLAMLAHEFGNILHPIRLSVERIEQTTREADTREAAAVIKRQALRLDGLVEDLRRVNRE